MGRQILFRAWDKTNRRMCHVWSIGWKTWDDPRVFNGIEVEAFGKDADGTYTLLDGQFELLQFTGLKDKNGKEIYEGDIVRSRFIETQPEGTIGEIKVVIEPGVYDYIGRIVFADGAFRWLDIEYKSWEECRDDLPNETGEIDPEDDEVIGNIHEHPHLLGEKKAGKR